MTSVSLFLYDIYVQNLQDSDEIRCINANMIAFHMYNLYGAVLWDRESCHLTIVISKREFLFFSLLNNVLNQLNLINEVVGKLSR